jgi:hypothetical protein
LKEAVFVVLPAGLRLRMVQPLVDRDQSCPLLYDLERALLVAVPEELWFHAALALEGGNLDDDLVGWLAGEDLLTYDDPPPAGDAPWQSPLPPAGGLGSVWFAEDEVHCHPGPGGEGSTLAAVEALLDGTPRGSRFVVHLVAEGSLGRPSVLRQVVRRAERLGRHHGRRVSLELTTDGRGLSGPMVRFLADHDLAVRLTGGSPELIERLVAFLSDRLTLCAVLDTGDRLSDLWRKAGGLGVRRLHATKIADRSFGGTAGLDAELRQYRRDLFEVADATFAALADRRPPLPLYEPLARVVRRHLSGRPAAVGGGGSAGYFGLVARGGLVPMLAPLPHSSERSAGGEAGAGDELEPMASCETCWGRRLCARSRYAIADPGPFRPAPRADRCELWRAEVEVGLLLYSRLEEADPATFLGLVEGRADAPFFDPYAVPVGDSLKTC